MRVQHVIKVTGVAGAERHLLTLIPGLRERGVDARLLALVEPDNPVEALRIEAERAQIPFERMVIRSNADARLIGQLRAHFRKNQPEIVHTHLLHADLYGIPAARLAGVPRVITSRHNDDDFRRKTHWRAIHRVQWRMLDAGIGISDAIRRFCIDVEGAPPEKVTTVRYGIDAAPRDPAQKAADRAAVRAELGIEPDAPIIGMVGRLIPQKGFAYGIEAFAALNHPTVHLVIAGDGSLRPELEEQAADRVHFLGWRTDIDRLMRAFDVFLMPSLWEGFGLVLLETMVCAVPVIASRVSAIPEIVVDGETGILAPPRDSAALTAALDRLLNDADVRTTMGSAGAARVRDVFGAARMIDATYGLYESVLTDTTPHPPPTSPFSE